MSRLDTAHERVCHFDRRRAWRQLPARGATKKFFEKHTDLETSERHTQAEVRAETECDVVVRRAIDEEFLRRTSGWKLTPGTKPVEMANAFVRGIESAHVDFEFIA